MKKLVSVILAMFMVLCVFAGCSDNSAKQDSNLKTSTNPVKITDNFTWEDPSDLDFDARYVVHCNKDSVQVSYNLEAGMTDVYFVIYSKGENVVAEYGFSVFDTPENAAAYNEAQKEFGLEELTVEDDASVLYTHSDEQALNDTFTIYKTYGVLDDCSITSYINFTLEGTGGVLLD